MRNFIFSLLIPFFFSACNSPGEGTGSRLQGSWKAQWDTDPSSFPEVSDASIFTMNGDFTFDGDQVTVTAQGFPGCIFSTDTLSHTLKWRLSNDTLNLINEGDIYGMTYKVLEMQDLQIRLQLMDDIIVTLSR